MRRTRRGLHPERGGIMIQALIVLAGLVALLATLAADQRLVLQQMQNRLRSRRAEMAARSAVERAIAVLQPSTTGAQTTTTTSQTTSPGVISQLDDWYTLGNNGNQAYDLGDSTFRLQIMDAGSRVNINTATQQQLQLLPITQEQLDSLLDWRETSLQARVDGAKDAYYNALDPPYNTKLGQLSSMSELLLIKGWTGAALFGTQTDGVISTAVNLQDTNGQPLPLIGVLTTDNGAPNQQANGTPRINLNQRITNPATLQQIGITGAAAAQIAARAPYASFQAILSQPGINTNTARQILNAAGFSAATRVTGKININTASQAVLETVPGITPEIASAIVAQQQSGFQGLGDLASVGGMNVPLLARTADSFTVGSDTFIVRAYGESGGYGVALLVTLRRQNNLVQIVHWERLPDISIPTWWNWNPTPDTTTDAGASS